MCRPALYRAGRGEELSVIQQFVRHVLQTKIKKEGLERVSTIMQMFPWQSEYEFILSEFKTLITFQAKFNEMECIAILLKDLK